MCTTIPLQQDFSHFDICVIIAAISDAAGNTSANGRISNMAWIKVVEEEEATGVLETYYEKYGDSKLGVDNIRAHARELTDRLQNELPSERYTSITPKGTEAAIVVFLCKDTEDIRNRIRQAKQDGRANISIGGPNSGLTVGRNGNQMRFSVSVFNNHDDIDRVLDVLS